jgi:hypothetical protein
MEQSPHLFLRETQEGVSVKKENKIPLRHQVHKGKNFVFIYLSSLCSLRLRGQILLRSKGLNKWSFKIESNSFFKINS